MKSCLLICSQGLIHSAHPYVDDKEFITLLPELLNPGYTAVRMLAGTNERVIIGRVRYYCRFSALCLFDKIQFTGFGEFSFEDILIVLQNLRAFL